MARPREHGRIVHEIGEGREVAFDATVRDSVVDEIFDRVASELARDLVESNRELRERIRELRRSGSTSDE